VTHFEAVCRFRQGAGTLDLLKQRNLARSDGWQDQNRPES
jgi:hypothetical protein